VFHHKKEHDFNGGMVEMLDITIKDIQEFRMNKVEILTKENPRFIGFYGDNIYDLEEDFMP
jgi:hypothetical protein